MNQISELLYNIAEATVHPGEIRAFSGATVPKKWKACDGSTGSNTPHNTMMPYAACQYIIYTGEDIQ